MKKACLAHCVVRRRQGFSLLETLVVLSVFSILAIVSTTAVLLAVRGAKKSDTSARVRQNVDYAIAAIERQLRNATEIIDCQPNSVSFQDRDAFSASYTCVDVGSDGYLASGSARLTSDEISITGCSFACTPQSAGVPPSVTIDITAKDKSGLGAQGAMFSTSTQIFTRSY